MSHLVPNSFSTYALTEEEALAGSVFTLDQIKVLQNELAIKAEEKLALEFDVAKPNEFIQQESYHRGQLELLRYLIENSAACQASLNSNNQ